MTYGVVFLEKLEFLGGEYATVGEHYDPSSVSSSGGAQQPGTRASRRDWVRSWPALVYRPLQPDHRSSASIHLCQSSKSVRRILRYFRRFRSRLCRAKQKTLPSLCYQILSTFLSRNMQASDSQLFQTSVCLPGRPHSWRAQNTFFCAQLTPPGL